MKYALIGQDIAPLLPSLLTDLLQAGHLRCDVFMEEKNGAMQSLLEGYGNACFKHAELGGSFHATASRQEVLHQADVVIYAGDVMAASRFDQDRQSLMSPEEGQTGLENQARVLGGIGGLMHTLRQGSFIRPLCEDIRRICPSALVICMAEPVARCTEMFRLYGFQVMGLGKSPIRGPGGVDGMARKMGMKLEDVEATWVGLPSFQFLTDMVVRSTEESVMDTVRHMTADGIFGEMPRRWLRELGGVSVGSSTDHAQFMAAQDGYEPDEHPELSESVEHRKNRILQMSTVSEKGLFDPDGMIAQLTLLTRTGPLRPGALSIALMKKTDLNMPGVCRRNDGRIPGLPDAAMVEMPLVLFQKKDETPTFTLPPELLDLMTAVDEANRLAARSAFGDTGAMREYVETDPALEGLDRLYMLDVVYAMIRSHADILDAFDLEEDEE